MGRQKCLKRVPFSSVVGSLDGVYVCAYESSHLLGARSKVCGPHHLRASPDRFSCQWHWFLEFNATAELRLSHGFALESSPPKCHPNFDSQEGEWRQRWRARGSVKTIFANRLHDVMCFALGSRDLVLVFFLFLYRAIALKNQPQLVLLVCACHNSMFYLTKRKCVMWRGGAPEGPIIKYINQPISHNANFGVDVSTRFLSE